jgi:hypothetical protein
VTAEELSLKTKLIAALIEAEGEVYIRTQLGPFDEAGIDRKHCWQTLGKIHDALMAAGITVHNPVSLEGKPL